MPETFEAPRQVVAKLQHKQHNYAKQSRVSLVLKSPELRRRRSLTAVRKRLWSGQRNVHETVATRSNAKTKNMVMRNGVETQFGRKPARPTAPP